MTSITKKALTIEINLVNKKIETSKRKEQQANKEGKGRQEDQAWTKRLCS